MNKMVTIAEGELFDACHVLFGRQIEISRGFLQYLQPSGVKTAYRSKARETHPDMLSCESECRKRRSAELFQQVQQAYESLNSYLDARDRGLAFLQASRQVPNSTRKTKPRASSPRKRTGSASTNYNKGACRAGAASWHWRQGAAYRSTDSVLSKQAPARKLLFGHYLFYCGVANWQTIIKALVWQRMERPRLGEIGKRFGWLTNADIVNILRQRKLSRSFGRSAVEMGLLTDRQLNLMVFQQNRLQRKIGEYFIHNNLLSRFQLNRLVEQFRSHNSAVNTVRRAS